MTIQSAPAARREPIKERLRNVFSPQLRNRRDVDVYLPASYDSGARYPVVYMQDGQNLSDPAIAFAGTWQLDAAVGRLAALGIEPIVVGVHNTSDRLSEYSPFPDPKHGGGNADAYLSFLIDTLKPRIDRRFRTRRAPHQTALVGSSMGGLLALYGWLRRPDTFALAGAMSPSLWFGRGRLFEHIRSAPLPRTGRLYVDVGTAEGIATLRDARALRSTLHAKRIKRSALDYVEERGGRHEESAWARRLDRALAFLLAGTS